MKLSLSLPGGPSQYSDKEENMLKEAEPSKNKEKTMELEFQDNDKQSEKMEDWVQETKNWVGRKKQIARKQRVSFKREREPAEGGRSWEKNTTWIL